MATLSAIKEARHVIAGSAIRTPLVRLNVDSAQAVDSAPAEIYLKLENLQPIGSFKIRGAANAIAHLSSEQLKRGVVTASAGNMAQGVAWCARSLAIPCTVIAPDTAPDAKVHAIERLGGLVIKVPFAEWWRAFEERAFPGVEGTFIHAFEDPHAIVIPWGGGGLTCGIASAMRELSSTDKLQRPCRIFAAEVNTAAPLAASLAAGAPTEVNYQPSWVDGIGAKAVFPQMFERARTLIDDALVADLDSIAAALRLLVSRNHIVAEGAGACPLACTLSGSAGKGKIVCIISGGNINPSKLASLLSSN